MGGLIGGLPSTILVSLLFIGITQTPRIAAETTTLIPLIQGVSGVFVLVYLAVVRRGLMLGLTAGLGVWVALAGSIAAAVLTGKLLGPTYGGIFAAFPATFMSALAITYRAGGADFSRAVGKAMMMSGMIHAALYSVAVRYAYVWWGLILGTAFALAFSALTAYLTYRLLRAGSPGLG